MLICLHATYSLHVQYHRFHLALEQVPLRNAKSLANYISVMGLVKQPQNIYYGQNQSRAELSHIHRGI